MTTIACSLTAADYRRRTADIGELVGTALRPAEPVENGLRLAFEHTGGNHRRLRELVAAEAECCSFLTFDLRRHGDELHLEVTGPAEAQPVIAEVFASDLAAVPRV